MIFAYKNNPIFYTCEGNGSAVLLLHGFLESSTIWERLIPELTAKHTVITIDLPGHGKSAVVSEEHSMELMAEVVKAVLDYLNIDSAILIGHSMGGYVALAFTELFEASVDKLVLLNSTSASDSPERKLNRERALDLIPQNPIVFINMAIRNLFAERSRTRYSEEIKQLQTDALGFPVAGIMAAIRGMKIRKDRTAVLKNFKGDKIIICGKEDPIVPINESRRLGKTTNSTVIILDGGHVLLAENRTEIVQIMLFIE